MIQNRAMLARLSISQWTARHYDKRVSLQVESAHSAHDAGRYNKLLVNKELLKPITALVSAIRDYHYTTTLPWSDGGERLLPSTLFQAYTQNIRKFKTDFNAAVAQLVHKYPAEVNAARNRLGTMYDPDDYPPAHELYSRFDLAVEFLPVPSANDFRVEVGADAVDEIREQIQASVNHRQQEAMRDCYRRVHEVVSKISERLGSKDAIFKDSLIENARELMDVLPSLNFTNDPGLAELHKQVTDQLLVPPDALRRDATVRQETADAADAILEKMKGWM